jgi:hypothetical protein
MQRLPASIGGQGAKMSVSHPPFSLSVIQLLIISQDLAKFKSLFEYASVLASAGFEVQQPAADSFSLLSTSLLLDAKDSTMRHQHRPPSRTEARLKPARHHVLGHNQPQNDVEYLLSAVGIQSWISKHRIMTARGPEEYVYQIITVLAEIDVSMKTLE